MKSDDKGSLFAPSGTIWMAPCRPTMDPDESPVRNPPYPKQQSNPAAKVFTMYHLSGSMSRWLPWFAALQPELFVELSPEHVQEVGLKNLDW